ncbi:MAG: phage holin family protein [Chloroflexi bacterium]|nr:phage holin family protein [Chloroflexota bacterium]
MGFLLRMIAAAASLGIADYLLEGIRFDPPAYTADAQTNYLLALGVAAIVLGVLNAIVRPILLLLSMPITCATLGLFVLVVNGLMLLILSWLPLGFHVSDLLQAIIGALIVSVVSFFLNRVVPG